VGVENWLMAGEVGRRAAGWGARWEMGILVRGVLQLSVGQGEGREGEWWRCVGKGHGRGGGRREGGAGVGDLRGGAKGWGVG